LDFDVTQEPDQRQNDKAIMELIKAMFVELRQMRDEAKIMRTDLHIHIQDEKLVINHAFPEGDTDGHRMAHEAWIKKAEESAKFYSDMRSTLAKWGLFGLISFLVAAAWFYILSQVRK
jgi:hypothetical protein